MTAPLHVCIVMSADLWAGAEAQVATAAGYLAEQPDIVLSAVLFNDGWLADELRRRRIRTTIFDEHRYGAMRLVTRLATYLRANAVDIVHTHRVKDDVVGALAARAAGVPHVVRTVHGLTEPLRGAARARYALYEQVDKLILRLCADRIVAVSDHTAQHLAAHGYPRTTLTTIRNGIDVRRVRADRAPDAVRRAFGITPDVFLIGTAGRLVPVKGHEYLIDAVSQLARSAPNVHLVIAGSGPREQELRQLAEMLDVAPRVLFVNPASDPRATIYDLMAALDVFVLPSLSEGMPMALLEAMTLGVPVVAAAVGGIPDVVTDRVSGILVEPRRPHAIAEACGELMVNRQWARRLGERGRQKVEAEFSHERNGRALLELYRQVVRDRRPRDRSRVGAGAVIAAPIAFVGSRVHRKVQRAVERRRAERLRGAPATVSAALARARGILIVCHGNIIRSPFAARLFAHLAAGRGATVTSAGLGAETGRRSHELAIGAAAPREIDLRDHTARRLTAAHVAEADAIFVMDVEQRIALCRRFPEAAHKTFLLTALAADTPLEVGDPIDGDASEFETCYAHIERAVAPLARALGGRAA